MGERTDLGAFTYIQAKFGVEIGDNVQIGSHCSIYSVSTIDNKQGKVVIGANACIGSHCTIMPGVTIGQDAVVGAHSFINKDIPDGAKAYGVPVKIIDEDPTFKTVTNAQRFVSRNEDIKISSPMGEWTHCKGIRGSARKTIKK